MATKKERAKERKKQQREKQVNDMNYSVASQHSKGQRPLTSRVTGSERECCVRRKKKREKKKGYVYNWFLSERQVRLTPDNTGTIR